jgi:hypothetical protein
MSEVTITELLDGIGQALLDNAERFTDSETLLIVRAAVQNDREQFAADFIAETIPNEV